MIALLLAAALARPAAAAPVPAPRQLRGIDAAVEESIARGDLPGAVVLVGTRDRVVYRKAFGKRAVLPSREPMTVDTVFDVASLTKPVVTATSVMILVERGKVALRDPVVRYIPEFAPDGGDRAKVTVEQLMTHRAGLPPDDPIEIYSGTPGEIFERKYRQPLEAPPGSRFRYSDVGYEVLGSLVERVSGKSLDRFAEENIFRPLGMKDSHFRPVATSRFLGEKMALADPSRPPLSRIAPTERRDDRWMRGEVHDPRAYALGGVAGHAGLFSTADDLSRFCRMILSGGTLLRARILSPFGVEALTRARFYGDDDLRALGWDVATAYSRNAGDLFPPGSFGHTGFTGTSLWIDPSSRSWVVFLSNRVHPDGKGDVTRLRGVVATIVAASLPADSRAASRRLSARVPLRREVLAGVDVLAADGFRAIAGKRVGLVTHAAGRARDGRSTIEVLSSDAAKKAGVKLALLFSPEHGISSDVDAGVPDQKDPATGLAIRSLYGDRRRPQPGDLADIDALVIDLQDVGVRFYTYITTTLYLLEDAARSRVPVLVLDRPDPISPLAADGPLADPDRIAFTVPYTLPVRYAMTPGELALLFDAERKIGANVEVVKMRGWSRRLWYDETGLEWANPSPNMRSLTAAALYPGIGLLETTNVSVGRGTDTPFEVVGAPWMDGSRIAAVLSARKIPGVTFTPIHFTPSASTFAGERCGGVRLTVTDRDALVPVALGIEVAVALRDLHAAEWKIEKFGDLLANRESFERLKSGEAVESIVASWKNGLEEFRRRRAKYLLY